VHLHLQAPKKAVPSWLREELERRQAMAAQASKGRQDDDDDEPPAQAVDARPAATGVASATRDPQAGS
jgi:hypothetical protein